MRSVLRLLAPAPAAGRPLLSLLALLTGLGLLLPGCAKDDDSPPVEVRFRQPNLYPEGVQYDAQHFRYLVGSETSGTVGTVSDNGIYTAFSSDPALVSSIGLHLDAARNRLLVAVSDPGYNPARTSAATLRKLARLVVLNRDNGQLLSSIDLGALRPGAGHFANDLTIDDGGNVYVTDSFSPIIYKADLQGTPSVFLENSLLSADAGQFGLNGIVFHPDGYLLVAKSDVGAIYKVPLNNPAGFKAVATGQTLRGADGLLLQDEKTLLVVCNSQNKVYRLGTADNWATANTTGTFDTPAVYPTTLARRSNADTYVLYSHLNELQANKTPPQAEYSIKRVKF
ncbi:gluconolaconase [Hymenobacter busanensis]|uniref:Gluconolaconase n=1 Tax=Hymenobacter busanensis TaxID=2607656 RepID=A0A7L5A2K7_9BACT|nr:gluconolaconase [Hymenobacter busanensis]KAA9327085.1 gluconolaconase [Hymenobacter busanensis]QHJ09537.1 gluconolaconase [Hymenobacter busanensis]